MTAYQDIRSVSSNLSTQDLLRLLLVEKCPGKAVVTASLKVPSIAVLKIVADIDPSVPVVFCTPGHRFPESDDYENRIVELLGLRNVSHVAGDETEVLAGDIDHHERMWVDYQDGLARVYKIVHLNKTLAPYDCWISAVYHFDSPSDRQRAEDRNRVGVESRILRVDPLCRWSKDELYAFVRQQALPLHPWVARRQAEPPTDSEPVLPSFNY